MSLSQPNHIVIEHLMLNLYFEKELDSCFHRNDRTVGQAPHYFSSLQIDNDYLTSDEE